MEKMLTVPGDCTGVSELVAMVERLSIGGGVGCDVGTEICCIGKV